MLDSGPLGKIAHPRPNPDISTWMMLLLETDVTIVIP